MASRLIVFIVALGLSNYLLRFLPAILLNKFSLPKVVEEWLSFIPVATMAALVIPELLKAGDRIISLSWSNQNLVSAIPTIIVAQKTKSLGFTLATGMGTMALLQLFY